MKGIVLAAGKGTRLYPITRPVPKPLLPVYDKPLIYYPLACLLEAGIREIMVIVPPAGQGPFEQLLGDGSQWGVQLCYREQPVQRGIADAFLIAEDFIGGDRVCLALGDNIFYGPGFAGSLRQAAARPEGGVIFGYRVEDPRPFGVVEFDRQGRAVCIEEKPAHPRSNYIVPGLYFYDRQVAGIARQVQPSARGELEITAVNNAYLQRGALQVQPLESGVTWLDAGTADSLLEAANQVRAYQQHSGTLLACLEQIAFERGMISRRQLEEVGRRMENTDYGQYLLGLL